MESAQLMDLFPTDGMTDLQHAVLAVDALNSWVRSPGYQSQGCFIHKLHHVVYWLKGQALRDLSLRSERDGDYPLPEKRADWDDFVKVRHSNVAVIATCRDCQGTGKFCHWNWDESRTKECRECVGSGQVILYFVESAIRIGWIGGVQVDWHSPADRFPAPANKKPVNIPYRTKWQTNTPGKDLTPAQVAECLNRAETFYPERPGKRFVSCDGGYSGYSNYTYDGYYVDDFDYMLFIGATSGDLCDICGASVEHRLMGKQSCVGSCYEWLAHFCLECGATKNVKQILEATPPAELLQPESIREWILRRHSQSTFPTVLEQV